MQRYLQKNPLNTKVFKQRASLVTLCIQSPVVDPAGSVKQECGEAEQWLCTD